MGLILDTSAVIGLFELEADRSMLLDAIRSVGSIERPVVHAVTIGELWAGVFKAEALYGAGSVEAAARRRTLATVVEQPQRKGFDHYSFAFVEEYGRVSQAVGRRVGHNDRWIIATAVGADLTLITQDGEMASRARTAVPALKVGFVPRQPR